MDNLDLMELLCGESTLLTCEAEAYSASAAVLRTPAAPARSASASACDSGRAGPALVSPAALHATRDRSNSPRRTFA